MTRGYSTYCPAQSQDLLPRVTQSANQSVLLRVLQLIDDHLRLRQLVSQLRCARFGFLRSPLRGRQLVFHLSWAVVS